MKKRMLTIKENRKINPVDEKIKGLVLYYAYQSNLFNGCWVIFGLVGIKKVVKYSYYFFFYRINYPDYGSLSLCNLIIMEYKDFLFCYYLKTLQNNINFKQ